MLFTVKYSNFSTFTMVHVVAINVYTNLYRSVHVVSYIYNYTSLLRPIEAISSGYFLLT